MITYSQFQSFFIFDFDLGYNFVFLGYDGKNQTLIWVTILFFRFTKLSFILKLYHIKCMCGISDKGISMVLDLLKEAFTHAKLPYSFNDMKKVIRKLGLSYSSIHACPNDCMLYWEADAKREVCKVCEASRWKVSEKSIVSGSENGTKKDPAKVLRYFALKPRLQRLFMSSKTATYTHDVACNG